MTTQGMKIPSPERLKGASYGVWPTYGPDSTKLFPFLLLPTDPASICPPPSHCTSTHATWGLLDKILKLGILDPQDSMQIIPLLHTDSLDALNR